MTVENRMTPEELCSQFAKLHNSIIGVVLAEGGSVRAANVKSGASLPNQAKLETLIAQSELVRNVFRKNEDYFGTLHFITASYNNADIFLFTISINARNFVLAIIVSPPYVHEEIVGKIRQYFGEVRLSR